mgnify:CR=1 FL=1
MPKLQLSAPWTEFYRKLNALFAKDNDVNIIYDESNATIKIYVATEQKANALNALLPQSKSFGNIQLFIIVIPPNDTDIQYLDITNAELFNTAFENNDALYKAIDINISGIDCPLTYVIFNPEVVQFFNDDLSSIYGLTSTLYQEIAKETFELTGIMYSTKMVKDNLHESTGMPLNIANKKVNKQE